jgi:hypothetical protein
MKTEKNFIKRFTSGKPTKYDKEKHIGLLFNVFNKGKGLAAFFNAASIGKKTFYDWLEAHEEFKEAYEAAVYLAQEIWEDYPKDIPDFNIPYWSIIMRNRFGYGKPKVRIVKDATPIARMNAIWDGLEEGELSAQEATQLSSVANTHASILVNQKQGTEPFELETKEEIMAKVYAIQKVIDYKNGKL